MNLAKRIIRGWKLKETACLSLPVLALWACAKIPTHYIHPRYDFSLIQKAAVLPLENLSSDQQAGEKVRKLVVSELLAAGVFDVIDPGQVNRALVQAQIESVSRMSPEAYKKVGESLGAQVLIVGSVDTYERINVGGSNFAEVAMTLAAIDAATGTIVWSANHREGGVGVMGQLFGFGGETATEVAKKCARSVVATLFL